ALCQSRWKVFGLGHFVTAIEKLRKLNSCGWPPWIVVGNPSKQCLRSGEISAHHCNLCTPNHGTRPELIVRARLQSVDNFCNLVTLTTSEHGIEQRDCAIGLRNH